MSPNNVGGVERPGPADRAWVDGFPGSVTVCDAGGRIIDMNANACRNYANQGGRALIGRSIFDCHPEPAKTKLKELMDSGAKRIYTIQKDGRKQMVVLTPWLSEGKNAGYLDLSFEIPEDMPHFNRDQK
jgi:hypothetical protein